MTLTIYRTETGYTYAIRIGMPEEAAEVGEGESTDEALATLSPTPVQSAGRWPRDRDMRVIAAACGERVAELDDACGAGEVG